MLEGQAWPLTIPAAALEDREDFGAARCWVKVVERKGRCVGQ